MPDIKPGAVFRRPLLALPGLALLRPAAADAQSSAPWPQRPIRLVIGWPPGGSVDVFGRILQAAFSERLGQPVVIENLGGAAGRLGALAVARTDPDGYTLLLASDAHASNEALPAPGTQPIGAALIPMAQAVSSANVLATPPNSGIGDIYAFAAAARARPGALNIAMSGWGSAQHLTSAALMHAAGGLQVEQVSYRGAGPAVVDLLAGKVDAGLVSLSSVVDHAKQGRVKLLAVTTKERSAAVPEVPSAAETIAPGFDLASWQGFFAPAGTPAAVQRRLHEALVASLAEPRVATRLASIGLSPVNEPAEAFQRLIADTVARFTEVVRATGIRADGS